MKLKMCKLLFLIMLISISTLLNAQAPGGTMHANTTRGVSITNDIIYSSLSGYSSEISENIVTRFKYYYTNGNSSKPDDTIYQYESLNNGLRGIQDEILLQKYGVRWSNLSNEAKTAYNKLLRYLGEYEENLTIIEICNSGASYSQQMININKPSLIQWLKTKLQEILCPGTTLSPGGQVVPKYNSIWQTYFGFLIGSVSNFVGLEGVFGLIFDQSLEGIFGEVITGQNTWEEYKNSFLLVKGKAQYGNSILNEDNWGNYGIVSAEAHFKNLRKKSKQNISLGFIIDSSGSMSSNDPHNMRKEALEMIINDRLDGTENVFIVDFDESAKLMNSKTSGWNKSNLKNAVHGIDSSGGTNIRSGLDKMKASMENKGLDYSNTAVILLSDGMDASNYKQGTQWFTHNNIPVYTISFLGQSNETIMTEIAQLTGGNFMKARNAQEIFNIFNIFYNELSGSSMLFQIISNIIQGQSIFHQFFNDSTSPLYIPLIWGGSKISLTLTSPDGKTYNQGGSSAKWNIGNNYVTATIQKPAIGLWKATLHGVQIPTGGEPYSFEVHNKSDLEFDVRSSTQGLVNIDLVPNNANLIQSQTTNVKVLTPKGNSLDISSEVQNNRIAYIPNSGKGNYKFDIDIKGARTNGTQFQRHLVKYVFIGKNVNPYVAPIYDVMGNYVSAKVGSIVGAYQGLKCYVYRGDPNRIADRIAEGHITYCEKDKCTVQISRYDTMLKVGDILKLDIKQLIGD